MALGANSLSSRRKDKKKKGGPIETAFFVLYFEDFKCKPCAYIISPMA